ncbi:cytochrome P450 [Kitasatospora viridis]|uniref:Cytochrome P450 n=1 Tax=Kitasatospora viridis TaxID=281105 RepID=A0A561UAP0_9ACTN|nr:cytochrome P450 [Kitasatospora viridis]TWF96422.1 cytochrome P450 [Kitasatospora viridis]
MTSLHEPPHETAELFTFPQPRATGCPFDPPPAQRRPATRMALWDGAPCWMVTDYQDVRTVLSDRRFSADARIEGFPFFAPGRRAFIRDEPAFIRLDDPEHQRLRRMMTGDFLVKRVDQLRPRIQRIVDDALDAMIAKGAPADLVADFAFPIPSLVICELLGVPYEDHEFFQRQSRLVLDATAGAEQVKAAMDDFNAYMTELAASKKGEEDGIVARLASREDLTPGEVASNALLLLLAGHETTANMTSLSTLVLLRHPEQLAKLRAEPELVKGAVEELLRYLTIVHTGLPRVAVEDVELPGGAVVRAGEGVFAMIAAANRDEEMFGAGEELDITRDARRHLAFGFGVHQCLGQPLARVELQIALATLVRRLPGLRLAVPFEQVRFRTESLIYGLHELPLAW